MLVLVEIRKLVETNPLFADKLAMPPIAPQRLRTLVQLGVAAQASGGGTPLPPPELAAVLQQRLVPQPSVSASAVSEVAGGQRLGGTYVGQFGSAVGGITPMPSGADTVNDTGHLAKRRRYEASSLQRALAMVHQLPCFTSHEGTAGH